jgi:hypothetical protein
VADDRADKFTLWEAASSEAGSSGLTLAGAVERRALMTENWARFDAASGAPTDSNVIDFFLPQRFGLSPPMDWCDVFVRLAVIWGMSEH